MSAQCLVNGCGQHAVCEILVAGEWWRVCEIHAKPGHPRREAQAPDRNRRLMFGENDEAFPDEATWRLWTD